eukprot:gene9675-6772_t
MIPVVLDSNAASGCTWWQAMWEGVSASAAVAAAQQSILNNRSNKSINTRIKKEPIQFPPSVVAIYEQFEQAQRAEEVLLEYQDAAALARRQAGAARQDDSHENKSDPRPATYLEDAAPEEEGQHRLSSIDAAGIRLLVEDYSTTLCRCGRQHADHPPLPACDDDGDTEGTNAGLSGTNTNTSRQHHSAHRPDPDPSTQSAGDTKNSPSHRSASALHLAGQRRGVSRVALSAHEKVPAGSQPPGPSAAPPHGAMKKRERHRPQPIPLPPRATAELTPLDDINFNLLHPPGSVPVRRRSPQPPPPHQASPPRPSATLPVSGTASPDGLMPVSAQSSPILSPWTSPHRSVSPMASASPVGSQRASPAPPPAPSPGILPLFGARPAPASRHHSPKRSIRRLPGPPAGHSTKKLDERRVQLIGSPFGAVATATYSSAVACQVFAVSSLLAEGQPLPPNSAPLLAPMQQQPSVGSSSSVHVASPKPALREVSPQFSGLSSNNQKGSQRAITASPQTAPRSSSGQEHPPRLRLQIPASPTSPFNSPMGPSSPRQILQSGSPRAADLPEGETIFVTVPLPMTSVELAEPQQSSPVSRLFAFHSPTNTNTSTADADADSRSRSRRDERRSSESRSQRHGSRTATSLFRSLLSHKSRTSGYSTTITQSHLPVLPRHAVLELNVDQPKWDLQLRRLTQKFFKRQMKCPFAPVRIELEDEEDQRLCTIGCEGEQYVRNVLRLRRMQLERDANNRAANANVVDPESGTVMGEVVVLPLAHAAPPGSEGMERQQIIRYAVNGFQAEDGRHDALQPCWWGTSREEQAAAQEQASLSLASPCGSPYAPFPHLLFPPGPSEEPKLGYDELARHEVLLSPEMRRARRFQHPREHYQFYKVQQQIRRLERRQQKAAAAAAQLEASPAEVGSPGGGGGGRHHTPRRRSPCHSSPRAISRMPSGGASSASYATAFPNLRSPAGSMPGTPSFGRSPMTPASSAFPTSRGGPAGCPVQPAGPSPPTRHQHHRPQRNSYRTGAFGSPRSQVSSAPEASMDGTTVVSTTNDAMEDVPESALQRPSSSPHGLGSASSASLPSASPTSVHSCGNAPDYRRATTPELYGSPVPYTRRRRGDHDDDVFVVLNSADAAATLCAAVPPGTPTTVLGPVWCGAAASPRGIHHIADLILPSNSGPSSPGDCSTSQRLQHSFRSLRAGPGVAAHMPPSSSAAGDDDGRPLYAEVTAAGISCTTSAVELMMASTGAPRDRLSVPPDDFHSGSAPGTASQSCVTNPYKSKTAHPGPLRPGTATRFSLSLASASLASTVVPPLGAEDTVASLSASASATAAHPQRNNDELPVPLPRHSPRWAESDIVVPALPAPETPPSQRPSHFIRQALLSATDPSLKGDGDCDEHLGLHPPEPLPQQGTPSQILREGPAAPTLRQLNRMRHKSETFCLAPFVVSSVESVGGKALCVGTLFYMMSGEVHLVVVSINFICVYLCGHVYASSVRFGHAVYFPFGFFAGRRMYAGAFERHFVLFVVSCHSFLTLFLTIITPKTQLFISSFLLLLSFIIIIIIIIIVIIIIGFSVQEVWGVSPVLRPFDVASALFYLLKIRVVPHPNTIYPQRFGLHGPLESETIKGWKGTLQRSRHASPRPYYYCVVPMLYSMSYTIGEFMYELVNVSLFYTALDYIFMKDFIFFSSCARQQQRRCVIPSNYIFMTSHPKQYDNNNNNKQDALLSAPAVSSSALFSVVFVVVATVPVRNKRSSSSYASRSEWIDVSTYFLEGGERHRHLLRSFLLRITSPTKTALGGLSHPQELPLRIVAAHPSCTPTFS